MSETEKSQMTEDIEYLEKVFKKWTPHILTSPYIPTPSLLIKPDEIVQDEKKSKPTTTTKPSKNYNGQKYEDVINCLHKGAYAYSIGDYGTAINYFTKLLEIDWLKYSSYFYLVKTLIKLDIEKELLSIRTKYSSNDIKMKKNSSDRNN
jgi:hypothetical protein